MRKNKNIFESLLYRYRNSEYEIQQKAGFAFYMGIVMAVLVTLLVGYTSYLQIKNYHTLDFPVLIPEIAGLVLILSCIILIVKGYFKVSVNLLIISTLGLSWVAMFLDRGDALSRLDSIVFNLALLTLFPILLTEYGKIVLSVILLNLITLFVYIYVTNSKYNLPPATVIDYALDTFIAMAFIAASGYFTHKISRRSIERAVQDSEKRLIAEAALGESESRYKELSDMLPQTVFEMDKNSMLTYLNKNGQELFNYSSDDLKGGLSAFDLISEEDRPRIIENGRLLMNGILATNNEYFAKRKDNSKFPVQIYSRPIRRGDDIVGIRGICVDISDRKEAEKKIRQSEERYRIILEAFPDLIVMTDISGRIIYNNIPFTELTGFSRETGSESNLFTLIHPDDFDSISDLISELIEGHRRHTPLIEKRIMDTKGEYRWLSGVFSKVVIDNKRALQFIARDITAKKRIEEELEMHRTKLEYLVVERTEELEAMNEELRATNEELYYQRKELGETLESLKETQNKLVHSEKMAIVGLLSAGIAHEINNPLNFIKGGSLGLEDYFNDNFPDHLKNVERLFDAINTGVERSAGIVESLGHYSQAGYRGKKRCDISNILDNCLAIVRDQVMVKGEVEKNYTYEDYYLLGDEGKLHQAFLNILVNSLQAIEKEGLIRITTRLNNSHISIVFEDNGHGMNDDILLKIFDPFFTTRAPGSGKGMGLSITYQIIREHQGTITYTSEVGKGTIATVLLPLSVEADDSIIRKTLKPTK